MTPPVHEHARTTDGNGDTISIKLGGDFVRKMWPYLVGGGILLGGGGGLMGIRSEVKEIHDSLSELKGSVSTLTELVKKRR